MIRDEDAQQARDSMIFAVDKILIRFVVSDIRLKKDNQWVYILKKKKKHHIMQTQCPSLPSLPSLSPAADHPQTADLCITILLYYILHDISFPSFFIYSFSWAMLSWSQNRLDSSIDWGCGAVVLNLLKTND